MTALRLDSENVQTFIQTQLEEEGATLSPLATDVLNTHRIQITLRGRKYEMPMTVGVHYYLLFYYFFQLAVEEEGGKRSTVVALASAVEEENKREFSKLLLRHYHTTVKPTLERHFTVLAEHLQPANSLRIKESWQKELPGVLAPEEILFSSSEKKWSFVFKSRLNENELQQFEGFVPKQLGTVHEKEKEDEAVLLSNFYDDKNNNPFLLLQPEHFGIIVVYLRREETNHVENNHKKPNLFPLRWNELSYDQQVAIVLLVRSLGIVAFISGEAANEEEAKKNHSLNFTVPTADLHTSVFHPSMLTTKPSPAAETVKAEDEDLLVMPSVGCHLCGLAGHVAADCPYTK
ncbi:hypothetical protein, conserved [Angomonas deanei]|uniref:CCHC-type domain-containing protein n=1 Tax=Angomonas deanei TaxID=59799 RepID=A0A7G2CKU5_9TRYP|nr:hypothetical protein, conserved [Angomonas deanei]